MNKVNLFLSAVVIIAIMLSSCGSGSPIEERTSTEEGVSTEEGTSTEEGVSKDVNIGKQVWMSKNLNVVTFRNGTPIPEAKTNEDWIKANENNKPAWCYYNNDPANGAKYGKLYNWFAVNDPRGLAPKGYHIPSDEEWTVLTDYLGGYRVAGKEMKSTSDWAQNGYNTNSSGFSGLPCGARSSQGSFRGMGSYGTYWGTSWTRTLDYEYSSVSEGGGEVGGGFSVRCLRD